MNKKIDEQTLDYIVAIMIERKISWTNESLSDKRYKTEEDLKLFFENHTLAELYKLIIKDLIIFNDTNGTKALLLMILTNAGAKNDFDTFFEEISELKDDIKNLNDRLDTIDQKITKS